MAEEKASSPAPAAAPAPASGGGKSSIVLVALLVLNMVFIAAVGFMLWSGRKKEQAEPRLDQVIKGESNAEKQDAVEHENTMGKVVPLETFIVNLAGTKGRKVLKVNMEIEVKGETVIQEIDSRKAQIRDFIIIILSSKNYDEISTREGKDNLRNEIKDTLNSFLTKGKIMNVFFTEIIYN